MRGPSVAPETSGLPGSGPGEDVSGRSLAASTEQIDALAGEAPPASGAYQMDLVNSVAPETVRGLRADGVRGPHVRDDTGGVTRHCDEMIRIEVNGSGKTTVSRFYGVHVLLPRNRVRNRARSVGLQGELVGDQRGHGVPVEPVEGHAV